MNDILQNKIEQISNENEKIKESFLELLNLYFTPAFGSISKRDFEIAFFIELRKLGIIDDDIYNIISTLRITKSKAQTLLYEAELRTSSEDDLNKELKKLLLEDVKEFYKKNEKDKKQKIAIEITNPYLKDFVKNKLKNKKFLTDTSFNQDLIILELAAYISLLMDYEFDTKDKLLNKLQQQEGVKDVTKTITKEILTKITGETLSDLITNFVFNKGEE